MCKPAATALANRRGRVLEKEQFASLPEQDLSNKVICACCRTRAEGGSGLSVSDNRVNCQSTYPSLLRELQSLQRGSAQGAPTLREAGAWTCPPSRVAPSAAPARRYAAKQSRLAGAAMDGAIMARLDDALATIEAEREARLQLEARTARLEADLCAPNERPRCLAAPRPLLGREFWGCRCRRAPPEPRARTAGARPSQAERAVAVRRSEGLEIMSLLSAVPAETAALAKKVEAAEQLFDSNMEHTSAALPPPCLPRLPRPPAAPPRRACPSRQPAQPAAGPPQPGAEANARARRRQERGGGAAAAARGDDPRADDRRHPRARRRRRRRHARSALAVQRRPAQLLCRRHPGPPTRTRQLPLLRPLASRYTARSSGSGRGVL